MRLEHRFVKFIPKDLESGVIYISIRFRTAIHLCACGCGNKTVTPLSPAGWKLIFDGKTISLDPSIGNWNFPCRSHYWIEGNRIHRAEEWSDEKVQKMRRVERKEAHFKKKENFYRRIRKLLRISNTR